MPMSFTMRNVVWAGGEDVFAFDSLKDVIALENTCDCGIAALMRRFENDTWRTTDLRETIRVGLMGGGASPEDAMKKVKSFVDDRPLAPSVLLAHAIVASVILGVRAEADAGAGQQS